MLSALNGNISKVQAAEGILGTAREAVLPVVQESARIVARQTGLGTSQIEVMLPMIGILVFTSVVLILIRAHDHLRKQRSAELAADWSSTKQRNKDRGKFSRVSSADYDSRPVV